MKSKELNQLLTTNIKNIKEGYLEEISWQDGEDTGSHIIFGDVFAPYIIKCLQDNNETEIKICFSFIENILNKNDDYIIEVILFSVLERLAFEKTNQILLKKHMFPNTAKYYNEIIAKMG
jgi:hypothetical protein